jgi:hypothetical protein
MYIARLKQNVQGSDGIDLDLIAVQDRCVTLRLTGALCPTAPLNFQDGPEEVLRQEIRPALGVRSPQESSVIMTTTTTDGTIPASDRTPTVPTCTTPEDGDVVLRQGRQRDGTYFYTLHTASGMDQVQLRTGVDGVIQACAFAKRQHIRAWLTNGGPHFVLLEDFRARRRARASSRHQRGSHRW